MGGPVESVREDDYQGHHIVVRTSYQITVDGRPVTGQIHLSNEGQVGYHGLPNMTFDSAVGLVKALIDRFPQDFQGPVRGMSGIAGMPGMSAARTKARKPAAKSAPRKKS
jgi:hypothetical protein